MSDTWDNLTTARARGVFGNYAATMVVVGINVFMSLYGLSVFLETPEAQRKGRKRYITASFVITVLCSLSASLDMAIEFNILLKSTSSSHWLTLVVQSYHEWKLFVSYVVVALGIAVGDSLLVYRCYIMCMEFRWVTILPACTTLLALGLFIAGTFLNSNPQLANSTIAASTFLTVSTNIIVTSLITYRLLYARRALGKVLPSADTRMYTGVIAILVESAAPLTVFGLIAAVLQRVAVRYHRSIGFWICDYIFEGLFYAFCTLSPHLIIFRVTTGRSFTKFPTHKDGALSNPIQFAHRTAESSFLQSALSRAAPHTSYSDIEQGQHSEFDKPNQSEVSVINGNTGKVE